MVDVVEVEPTCKKTSAHSICEENIGTPMKQKRMCNEVQMFNEFI